MLTSVGVYAPTMQVTEETKEQFYPALDKDVAAVLQADHEIIAGDFNAWVSTNEKSFEGIIRSHGTGKINTYWPTSLSLTT